MKTILLIPALLFTLVQCKPTKTNQSLTALENTYWKLSEMNGNPVITPEGVKEAHFVLSTAGNQSYIKGFGGCNSLAGSYTRSGEQIKFTVISTKMMCPPEQMEVETFFMKALTAADSYKIDGEVLELYEGNTSLADFKAVYFK
jgi:heat shock protein HslJ